MPSSSTRVARTVRRASSASACRPARTRARAWVAHSASSMGLRAVADSVVASTPAWSPTASRPSSRASSAVARSRSREDRAARTSGWSGRSAYGSPAQVASTSSSRSTAPEHLLAGRPPCGRPDVELRRQGREHPAGGTHVLGEGVGVDGRRRAPQHVAVVRRLDDRGRPPGTGGPARGRCAGRTGTRAATPVRCGAVRRPTPGRPGCRPRPVGPASGPGRRRSTAACVSRGRPPRRPGR